ncbi:MAG: hypothetical protein H7A36_03230 [Chlamydiales bacterium]|nr:hypothetical protein [Chlamydiales bacterium]
MKLGLLIRLFICIVALGTFLYLYIDKQNRITCLRLQIPALAKELEQIQQESVRLQFEVDQFENPIHLMELARKPQYSHLRHPRVNEIVTIEGE